jgi:hypothetical protein
MNNFHLSTPFRRSVILNEVRDLPFSSDKRIREGAVHPVTKQILRRHALHSTFAHSSHGRPTHANIPLFHYSNFIAGGGSIFATR